MKITKEQFKELVVQSYAVEDGYSLFNTAYDFSDEIAIFNNAYGDGFDIKMNEDNTFESCKDGEVYVETPIGRSYNLTFLYTK
jgi:hypothetical protein